MTGPVSFCPKNPRGESMSGRRRRQMTYVKPDVLTNNNNITDLALTKRSRIALPPIPNDHPTFTSVPVWNTYNNLTTYNKELKKAVVIAFGPIQLNVASVSQRMGTPRRDGVEVNPHLGPIKYATRKMHPINKRPSVFLIFLKKTSKKKNTHSDECVTIKSWSRSIAKRSLL